MVKIFLTALACVAAFSGCVSREQQVVTDRGLRLIESERTAVEGQTIKLNFVVGLNPDCTVRDEPIVQIIEMPTNGVATVTKARDYTGFPPESPFAVCNKTKVSGIKLEYQSNSGFKGSDSVTVESISSTGRTTRVHYAVAVR